MSEDGLFKRLFRFGKKGPVKEVSDATSDTALGESEATPVIAHAEAAANVITDEEAGAAPEDGGGITPLKSLSEASDEQDETGRRMGDGLYSPPAETREGVTVETPEPLSTHSEPFIGSDDEPRAQPGSDGGFAGSVDAPDLPGGEETDAATQSAPKTRWFDKLRSGLSRSSAALTENITSVFTKKKLDEDTLQDLEDILIQADLGVDTAMRITDKLGQQRLGKDITDEEVRGFLAEEIEAVLEPVAGELELDLERTPHVILVVGVNGSGKTTTIGKLSQKLYDAGFSTLLVAGDTFRAAAIEQLKIWGSRTLSPVISRDHGADAAGLAFDAYRQAVEEERDVMLMDTAGRRQNKAELMEELAKIVRVLKKQDPTAPHTVLLTLDATTGQNALNQVDIFKDVAGVNGLVMTKLDGTARGGILVAIAAKHKLPVYFIGVGEGVEDLEPFEAREFAQSIAGLDNRA